jgi:hypothetical protein
MQTQCTDTGVDESLIHQHLELSPAERLRGIETMYVTARMLALAGARSRGNTSESHAARPQDMVDIESLEAARRHLRRKPKHNAGGRLAPA